MSVNVLACAYLARAAYSYKSNRNYGQCCVLLCLPRVFFFCNFVWRPLPLFHLMIDNFLSDNEGSRCEFHVSGEVGGVCGLEVRKV